MDLLSVVDLVAELAPDRVIIGGRDEGLTAAGLARGARVVAGQLGDLPGRPTAFLDVNSPALALTLFGAAAAGRPFAPLNYRLEDGQLRTLAGRLAPATVITTAAQGSRLAGVRGLRLLDRDDILGSAAQEGAEPVGVLPEGDADGVAVMLFTSGTTGEPKVALLRHRNLTSYCLQTLDLLGAGEEDASLVSVPPYHIAAISAAVTGVFAGRRAVLLEAFDAHRWVEVARHEAITHAMVVPTMLGRILNALDDDGEGLPSLRHLSYGGGPMPPSVLERALEAMPEVRFVNAYGLTETSSTITVLGPEDHRSAIASDDPCVRRRLGSAGRPVPGLDVSIRDASGAEVPVGSVGEIWVRGAQVAGEYEGRDGRDENGWFPTRDQGHLDPDGYLFVLGRLDDVIVRGGENLSPEEIETALLSHPDVAQAAVVGVPDDEWGQATVAAVVVRPGANADAKVLRGHVRSRLRSSKTPDRVAFVEELPFSETGKLLRRVLREQLCSTLADSRPKGME